MTITGFIIKCPTCGDEFKANAWLASTVKVSDLPMTVHTQCLKCRQVVSYVIELRAVEARAVEAIQI